MKRLLWLVLCGSFLVGCRDRQMYGQPRLNPLAEHPLVETGQLTRLPPPDTISRDAIIDQDAPDQTGFGADGLPLKQLPVPLTQALLDRGQERYGIYCTPCHGLLGDGRGMVAQRGFPAPPSYHTDYLRQAPVGHLYDVMTHGDGPMPAYDDRIPPSDRWAIAAYIRALQRSQHATAADMEAAP